MKRVHHSLVLAITISLATCVAAYAETITTHPKPVTPLAPKPIKPIFIPVTPFAPKPIKPIFIPVAPLVPKPGIHDPVQPPVPVPVNPWPGGHRWPHSDPLPDGYPTYGTVYYNDTYVTQPAVITTSTVEPIVATALRAIDLELLDVRQIDVGDATHGPAFRVVVRNNSTVDVIEAFDVTLFASVGRKLSAKLPHVRSRVSGLHAGQTAIAEVRLPIKSMAMAKNAAGESLPFTFLTVIVDGRREVEETNLENNFQVMNRAEIAMAD